MPRVVGNWLKAYLEYTKEQEAPESYHLWTGLSILASAVRRNVSLSQGYYQVYPNMYVILAGPAGKLGKSTVIRMGRKILREIPDIRWSADSVTREELIRFMSKSKVGSQSATTIHSTELSSIIDPSGVKIIQFLTDIYDCDDSWEYGTKTSGRHFLDHPCLNMLAGTTPSWLADGFPVGAVEHGFVSRTVFLYEDTPRFLIPRPQAPDLVLVKLLSEDLLQISMLVGEMQWTRSGEQAYDAYYESLYSSSPKDYRIAGFHWRKRVHILKVAMLLSIAENDDLLITDGEINEADSIIAAAEKNMHRAFSAVGKYEFASDLERILAHIVEEDEVAVDSIYRRNFAVGGEEVKRILSTLVSMSAIKISRTDDGAIVAQATAKASEVIQSSSQAPIVRPSAREHSESS